MALLTVRNLSKIYQNSDGLSDVSLTMEEGEVLVIIGASGCGKTTLLRILCGLTLPDSGSVQLRGENLLDQPLKIAEKLGLVFQDYQLFPHLNVRENIALPLKSQYRRKGKADDQAAMRQAINARTDAVISDMGLTEKADTYPGFLSGGQQQRVAIARALALNPEILLMDEPTSALDVATKRDVFKVLADLKRQGRSLIIVTHDIALAEKVATRVIFMDRGKILMEGIPEKVFQDQQNPILRDFLEEFTDLQS